MLRWPMTNGSECAKKLMAADPPVRLAVVAPRADLYDMCHGVHMFSQLA